VNRSNIAEVAAACNVILQFLLARLRQQHEHCTVTKVGLEAKVILLCEVFRLIQTGGIFLDNKLDWHLL